MSGPNHADDLDHADGPNYAEKCRWMGPSGRLRYFDNAPQDGDSVLISDAINVGSFNHRPSSETIEPTMPYKVIKSL